MGTQAPFQNDVRTALDAIRRIIQALRVGARAVERDLGISTAQLFALQQLAAAPGASINDVAARTFTHQSSVSVVIRRLVEQRLVAKVTAQDDRRRVRIALTERGRRVLRRAPSPVQERLIAALAALDDAERHRLASSLDEIARLVAASSGPAPMIFEEARSGRPRRASHRARPGLPPRPRRVTRRRA